MSYIPERQQSDMGVSLILAKLVACLDQGKHSLTPRKVVCRCLDC